ncbi:MAG: cupin domain-containing protein [Rhodospirillaceae bacterium]|nr:cupin domain-containing protein [Rhodospirillaceae bacterium]
MSKIELSEPTEQERATWPKEVIVELEKAFADARGEIQPLVDIEMKSCVLITSKKGALRANHYHKTDWHFCYVLNGSIEYHHRPHGDTGPGEKQIVGPGQLFFTPPMVDHSMVFLEETTFITLGRNSRKQEVYEADVERIELVKPEDISI